MKRQNFFLILSMAAIAIFAGCSSTDEEANLTTGPESSSSWDEGSESVSSIDEGSGDEVRIEGGSRKRGMFSPILFEFDSASLGSSDRSTLNKVGEYLETNPSAKILVEGNCDQSGTSEYNRTLGQRRAQAARSYLVSKGISSDRIGTVSYGEDKPVGSDAQNRRDDFVVVE